MKLTSFTARIRSRRGHTMVSIGAAFAVCAGLLTACGTVSAPTADPQSLIDRTPGLVVPETVHVATTDSDQARHAVTVAQVLYTFWNTGDTSYLERAVAPDFRDNTLPAGRPQGPTGPAAGSAAFRTAVPDLTCELADLYITGDTFTARLIFRGHFTGTYNGVRGTGQNIDFNAIDIQHIGAGDKITEDWHLEDNLTFLQQAGLVTVAGN